MAQSSSQFLVSPQENKKPQAKLEPLSVAPMMDWTDSFFRTFFRLISKRVTLYTEMCTTGAILKGERDKILKFNSIEHPIILQLGGDNASELARAAKVGQDYGYDGINLNVGCPSDRVQSGQFGACLMAKPNHVADLICAIKSKVNLPVTVKHRIGIDGLESYESLSNFVSTILSAGSDASIVHARIAILNGLSPKDNRTIPPLRYTDVYRLKADFPHYPIAINGGIQTLEEAKEHAERVDSVMMGRSAYENPFPFCDADSVFFGEPRVEKTRTEVLESFLPWASLWDREGKKPYLYLRHILGLFYGVSGGRFYRRFLSEKGPKTASGAALINLLLKQKEVLTARSPAKA